MKQQSIRKMKSFVLASIAALGAGLAAHADSTPVDNPAALVSGEQGLLGQSYATLAYGYTNLNNTSVDGHSYLFEVNRPLAFGFDGFLGYQYAETDSIAGSEVRQNAVEAGLRAFTANYRWAKPYVEAGAGYAWTRWAGQKDNSFFWQVGIGAEFAVAPSTTVTPYVKYVDVPDIARGDTWVGGAKGNLWLNSNWAITAGAEIDEDENTTFTIGTNFRF